MNYTIIIDEKERQIMAEALAIMARKIGTCTPVIDAKPSADQTRAIATPKSSAGEVRAYAGPAAAPTPAPIAEARDRWARDKKGNEVPWPKGCEEVERLISKTEQKPTYLRATWQAVGPNARGYVSANCFDSKLWPSLVKQTGQETTLYLVTKDTYINIVGVRA